ncbi:MAG TPA: hypothetical protein VMW36_06835 [Patescibacteria group bacterium]|nr:hypothetical protein [Patescibacteria group bacterium]
MPIPSALVTRFFQLLVNRQFSEAERELERLKQKMQKTEWNRGYFRALYGMFLSRKANGDSYAFFSKMDLKDRTALYGYRREFMEHVRNKLHGEFDRGFFSAWADCMRVLSRITIPENVTAPSPSSAVPQEPKIEEDQSTIESFLEEQAD